ncbi:MAG: MBL fold metallo-hydrolase, partial [Nitrospinaceae bacterium]|nr:MBL fold metallo-hydrolase [Nitrospinaceae bacterium]NIR56373.1 MBL fold metallo-hydrolase [Nitrospinaceae bacterium]NIS86835.1 MBL fold metallo-hydrolase [Nitrospinaceae bacterium]NIT83671.1 MBL fold metallo-hydrolase [Nitrospinaceae bacterium]NIU45869.1 MBL fold metallo-hydrolase [Nitrospinaceae bacterium]
MKILFLGTGTSTGVPSLCCDCPVCRSDDVRNKRLRASVLVSHRGHNTLIDTSTDLRQQCLIYNIRHIHSVLYTHHHADHVHGIDELRSFNYFNKTRIPCYGRKETLEALKKNFGYIFQGTPQEGGGIPQLNPVPLKGDPFSLGGIRVTPLDVLHGRLTITGFKLNHAAYITDCNHIPDATKEKIQNLDLLILNALGYQPHPTHFCLSEALEA